MNETGPHCWTGRTEWAEENYGYRSQEYALAVLAGPSTCMLPDGHTGPHQWTPDDQIMVVFPEGDAPCV